MSGSSGGVWSLGDGTFGEATHVSVDGSPWRAIVDISLEGGSVVPPPPPPPPPTSHPLLGIYHSNGAGVDGDSLTYFGRYAEAYNDYYQVATVGSLLKDQTARVKRGASPVLVVSTKGHFVNQVDGGPAAIVNGPSDPDYAKVKGTLDTFISQVVQLAKLDPSVPIWVSAWGEMDAKINKFQNNTSGDKIAATPEVGGQGLNIFLGWLRAACVAAGVTNVHYTAWFAYTQKTIIATILSQLDPANVTCIIGDPYTNTAGTETMLNCWNNKWLNWIKSHAQYSRLGAPELGIGECGMSVDGGSATNPHTDTQVATYIKPSPSYTMRDTLRDAGVVFAIWFDSPRDEDHEITDGSHPLACAAFAASLNDTP